MIKSLFLSAMGCMVLGGSAFAVPNIPRQELRANCSNIPSEITIHGKTLKTLPAEKRQRNLKPQKNVPVTDIIYDAPGEPKNYLKTVGSFIMYYYDEAEYSSTIVWDENGDVYFKDIISIFVTESYVKGSYSDGIITLPMNQTVYYVEDEDYGLNLGVFKSIYYNWDDEPVDDPDEAVYVDMVLETDIDSVTFTVAEDGTVTLQLPGTEPDYLLGYYYTDYEESFYLTDYIFDYYQVYVPVANDVVTMPEGTPVNTFSYIYNPTMGGLVVNVGEVGNDLYIQGLSQQLPEATFVATVLPEDPTLAIVPAGQLVGMTFDRKFVYTNVGYPNPDYDPDDYTSSPVISAPDENYYLKVEYAADGKTIASLSAFSDNLVLVFNASLEGMAPVDTFFNLYLKAQDTFAGTPIAASGLQFDTNVIPVLGFANFLFNLPNISTQGNVLMPDNLSYSVIVDSEPIVFMEEKGVNLYNQECIQYEGVTEPTEWLPYTFQNDWDIYKRVGQPYNIGIYIDGVTTIGVQACYTYEGNTTYSAIVTLNLETGDVTTGVEGITNASQVVTTEYFTLDGVKVNNPDKGIYVKRSVNCDGSVTVTKVIR